MQVVLVAGGAGFIGSHLCRKLLERGYKVICLDTFLTSSKETITDLLSHPQFIFREIDVTKPLDEFANYPISHIFHLASPASPNAKSPRSYIQFPIETLLANSLGTYNLLELARHHKALFLFASTSEVYGDPEVSPQIESYFGNVNPNGIRSVYDEGKRFGEAMTMAYMRKFGLDTRIVRIFNTYGPSMQVDDGRVVSNFITQALRGESITIYGAGTQTRSFCYVDDMIIALLLAQFNSGTKGEVINIGNPEEKTVRELAEMIIHMTNSPSTLAFEPLPMDDPQKRMPDITKAKKLLGFSPRTPLAEGLIKTIEYFKTQV